MGGHSRSRWQRVLCVEPPIARSGQLHRSPGEARWATPRITALREEVVPQAPKAAVGEGPLEPRTAILLALAGPCRAGPALGGCEVATCWRWSRPNERIAVSQQRIAEATEQVPAATAAKKAIEATASVAAASGGAAAAAGS